MANVFATVLSLCWKRLSCCAASLLLLPFLRQLSRKVLSLQGQSLARLLLRALLLLLLLPFFCRACCGLLLLAERPWLPNSLCRVLGLPALALCVAFWILPAPIYHASGLLRLIWISSQVNPAIA